MTTRAFCRRLGGAVLALVLAGCAPQAGPEGPPTRLRVGFSVNDEELVEKRSRVYADICAYLEERLGVPVEAVRTTGYGVNVEAMRSRKMDISSFSPLPYMLARQEAGVEPLVVLALPDGRMGTYRSLLITHPGSGLKSMHDVKARAAELTLAFANPASTSGHLIPRSFLEAEGIVPEKQFKRVFFSENHVVSVMNVRARKLELAAVTKTTLDRMIARGSAKASDFVVLWESEPLMQSVVTVRKDLPAEFKQRLLAAYLDLPAARPEVWKTYASDLPDPRVVYAPARDAMFDEYRRIASNVAYLKLIE